MKKQLLLAAIVVMAMGCNHGNEDAHCHSESQLILTSYTETYEFFAEYTHFSVGHTSEILLHVTDLNTFKPLENASVTAQLTVGEITSEQISAEIISSGIYKFEITPEKQGKSAIIFSIQANDNSSTTIDSVMVYADEHEAEHYTEEHSKQNTTGIHFSKEQSWQTDFAIEEVHTESFGKIIKTVAHIEPAQGDEIVITAKTNGIIMFTSNTLFEGKKVNKGEVICSISGKELADNNITLRFSEAKNNYETAKLNYERVQSLATEKIVSEKERLTAQNSYENAKAIYEQLTKNFDTNGQRVTASMNGFVKQVFVENGNYVETGQPILTIAKDEFLTLKADVRSKYAPLLNHIYTAAIFNPLTNESFTLEELQGSIVSYGKAATSANFTLPITLKIKNTGNFVVGTFVDLYLKARTEKEAITIDNKAIMEDQGTYYVFVRTTPELFEKQFVQIGATDGFRTEITHGLNIGQHVVTQGAILIKLAQAAGKIDAHAGHAH